MACRFVKPVYDGRMASVAARQKPGGLDVEVESEGVLCATGEAALDAENEPVPALEAYPEVPPAIERPLADEASLRPGRWLGIAPVHALAEIELLAGRFPRHIALHLAIIEGRIVGGTVLYVNRDIVHVQYIASTEEGRAVGALDRLFAHLIGEAYADASWFSFGSSNDPSTSKLNHGLVHWKEGFGARAWPQDVYTLSL